MHFNVVLAALLDDPARLLEIAMAKSLLALSTVIARVMNGRKFFVPGFIDLDSSRLDILLQKIMD
jgi:hypothetical protein